MQDDTIRLTPFQYKMMLSNTKWACFWLTLWKSGKTFI